MGNCSCKDAGALGKTELSETIESRAFDVNDIQLLDDAFAFWDMYRNSDTGLYYDAISVLENSGDNEKYSISALGFGLIINAVLWELSSDAAVSLNNTRSPDAIKSDSLQALQFVKENWPRDATSGFFCHFIKKTSHEATGDHSTEKGGPAGSTIDTSIFLAGALFLRNYANDAEITSTVDDLVQSVSWEYAINPERGIAMVLIDGQGAGTDADGNDYNYCAPWNEYYLVAYLAKTFGNNESLTRFFDQFFYPPTGGGQSAEFPTGGLLNGNQYPKPVEFGGNKFLSDQDAMQSSFVPLFCRFLSKSFSESLMYQNMLKNYALGDASFWSNFIDQYGADKTLKYAVWGCGAGKSPDDGDLSKYVYVADHMDNDIKKQYDTLENKGNASMVYSLPIMAGFLVVDDEDVQNRLTIKDKLKSLYMLGKEISGVYEIANVGTSNSVKVLWRGSARYTDWKADRATCVDYAPFILGYATLFMSDGRGFYLKHSV